MWLKFEKNTRNQGTQFINLDRVTAIIPSEYGNKIIFEFCNNAKNIVCESLDTRNKVFDIIQQLLSGTEQTALYEMKKDSY